MKASVSNVFGKDPDATIDYQIDWSSWLLNDTILSSEWEVADGIVADSDESTATTTKIWLSGGTVGSMYALTNRITTAGGRINDQTIRVKVEQR